MFQFIFICASSLLLAYIADKKDSKIFLWLLIFILTLTSGLRGVSVGIDTILYENSFINDFPYAWQFKELGFRFISRFLMNVFDNNTIYLFVFYSFLINSLILLKLWESREKCSYTFMVFLYLTIYYIPTMNVMRQFVAVAIVFYATRFLEKKQYILFLLMLFIATSIHMASLMGVAFFFVYVWKNATSKQRRFLFIPVIAFGAIACYAIYIYEHGHIMNYFSKNISNINFTYLYRILCFIFALYLQRVNINLIFGKSKRNCALNKQIIKSTDYETIFCFMGLVASTAGMFFMFLSRLGYYYLLFELVFWGRIKKGGKSREICALMISLFAVYVFVLELIKNGSGIFPYSLRWF